MRIPTAESEVGYVTKHNWGARGASYYWSSLETTYAINCGNNYRDKGRKMTWAEFVAEHPYGGRNRSVRYKEDPKSKW